MAVRKVILFLFLCIVFSSLCAQLTYNELMVQYDSAWQFKNLKLIPIRFKNGGGENLPEFNLKNTISFQQAFNSGKIKVREIEAPQGSDIGVLQIKNLTKKNILVHSGDIIAGGKQNRTSAESIIIPATEGENYLQVFCVEKQRWDDKSKTFTYGGMADADLRKIIDVDQKQNKVWKEIDDQFKEKNIQSTTWNYISLYKDSANADSAYLHYFIKKMKESDSSFAGFVAVSGTRIINCELFGNVQLTLINYESLVRSYIHSIVQSTEDVSVSNDEVKNFLNNFLENNTQQQEYAILHGRIYKQGNEIIHLVVYGE